MWSRVQILVTISLWYFRGAGVEFPTFAMTCVVVVLKITVALPWHYQRVISSY